MAPVAEQWLDREQAKAEAQLTPEVEAALNISTVARARPGKMWVRNVATGAHKQLEAKVAQDLIDIGGAVALTLEERAVEAPGETR